MTDNNNPLGDFSKLPPEVRSEIWSYLRPQSLQGTLYQDYQVSPSTSSPESEDRDERFLLEENDHTMHSLEPEVANTTPSSDRQKLAILRTSQFLNEEVSSEIYQVFTISIRPRCSPTPFQKIPATDINSSFAISNNFGDEWNIESFQHAISIGFVQGFPWHKVQHIRIEIGAPSPSDGELICAYQRTRDVVEMIQRPGKSFKSIEVLLKDTEEEQWFSKGRPQITTAENYDMMESEREDIHNYEVILDLFNRLRHFNSAKVHTTQSPLGSNLDDQFERLEKVVLVETTPFGDWKKHTHSFDFDDKETSQRLGDRYLMMERFLDRVKSPFGDYFTFTSIQNRSTADLLRLERFRNWYPGTVHGYSKYEMDLIGIIFSGERSLETIQLEVIAMDERYRSLRMHGMRSRYWSRDNWQLKCKKGIKRLNSTKRMLGDYDHPLTNDECYFRAVYVEILHKL